ncbi:hypothetical protein BDR06DRAFT_885946, partial [Suillus hirtellus]
DIIQEITVPSWFTSAPSDFRSASAGTMKADEWRSLITVYIPIALVSLILQRLPVNHKIGELEATMLYSFIKTSKLCCWLSQPDCLPAIQECKILFDKMSAPKSATNLGEELTEDPLDDSVQASPSASAVAVPEDLYALIKRRFFFYPRGDRLSSPVSWVVGHFARWAVSSDTVVVLSLSRD